jgi:hypothetical protein
MKSTYLIAYPVLLLYIFLGLPDSILYSQDTIRWLPFILIFFVQTFVLYKLLSSFNILAKNKQLLVAISILVLGPAFGLYLGYKEKKTMDEHGVETQGVVYKKWYNNGKNGGWLFRCNFKANTKSYSTFSITDKHNTYKIGDTLTVLYNENFPQQCIIKEVEDDTK